MIWPEKSERENLEITGFIEAYSRKPGGPHLSVLIKQEKPDFVLMDTVSGREFGVELTSVYSNNRSIPDFHKIEPEGLTEIPYDENAIDHYMERIVVAIKGKVDKARTGYDLTRPLILSIYMNEYSTIFIDDAKFHLFVKQNEILFDSMMPFSEIVFWNLGNGRVTFVQPTIEGGAQPGTQADAATNRRRGLV